MANQGIKAYDKHKQAKAGQQQPPQYPQYRDVTGYLHQPWCNGQCNCQCNGNAGHAIRNIEEPMYSPRHEQEKDQKLPAY